MTWIICDTDNPFPTEVVPISSASLRCSRPLCSSQNTGGTPPPHNQSHVGGRSPEVRSTTTLLTKTWRRPGPSGPNSVHKTVPERTTVPNPEGLYWVRTLRPGQCQCSTHERQQETFVPELTYEADKRCIQTLSSSAP